MGIEQPMDDAFGAALDIGLGEAMDVAFELIKWNPQNKDTDDQLRMRIVAHNLHALAQVLLIADDHQGEGDISLNIKQLVLGLLGTSDWLIANIPQLEEAPPDPNQTRFGF